MNTLTRRGFLAGTGALAAAEMALPQASAAAVQQLAQPANALIGHLIGIGVGWAMLTVFHLDPLPPAPIGGLSAGYVLAGALSVALTSLILIGIGRPHPPAGASTLIVSLGILTTPVQLGTMALAVLFLTVAGWGLNAALGLRGAQLTRPQEPA